MELNKEIEQHLTELHPNVSKVTFLGAIICLLMNKELFKRNSDVNDFITSIFNIAMPVYATRSRTLMVAKICRVIVSYNDEKIKKASNNTCVYINGVSKSEVKIKSSSLNKNKNNALDNMNMWIDGILNKDE